MTSNPSVDILVVDDERRIAETLALILRTQGYSAESTYDGAAAFAMCSARPPRMVISDVVMPVMDGIELAIRLRTNVPQTAVLLFSGQAATADMLQEAKSRGYEFELLAKPIHPEELLVKVKELIGGPAA